MAKRAHLAGAYEALLIALYCIVTGKQVISFFFIKDREICKPVTNDILHGITRQTMLRVAETFQLRIREENYTLDQVPKFAGCRRLLPPRRSIACGPDV